MARIQRLAVNFGQARVPRQQGTLAAGSFAAETAREPSALKGQARFIEEENLSAVMVTLARQGVTMLELEWE